MAASDLLGALSAAVFQGDYSRLSVDALKQFQLEHLIPFWLPEEIPENKKARVEAFRQALVVHDLKMRSVFAGLDVLFHQHRIRFCPLKGADLAWRVYPNGAWRLKDDIDILIHPDDLDRAVAALQTDGWHDGTRNAVPHHLPQMEKDGALLEIHFHLNGGEHIDDALLWSELHAVDEFRHQLPLEMNLLMLFAHDAVHFFTNGIKMLLDYGFLLKAEGAPDWDRVEELARRLQLRDPALLFCAFPDFFPPEMLPQRSFSPDVCTALRAVICHNVSIPEQDRLKGQCTLFLPGAQLRKITPDFVRQRLGISRGNVWRLLGGYGCLAIDKLRRFLFYRFDHRAATLRQRGKALGVVQAFFDQPEDPAK